MVRRSTSVPSPRIGQGILNYSPHEALDNIAIFGVPNSFQQKKRRKK